MTTGIRLNRISKIYGAVKNAVRAVDDVSFEVAPGEFYFLLGPSGCGKTTLLRIIAGLVTPTSGNLYFGDRNVTAEPVEKRDTALVFQNYALWPHMTVQANVAFGPAMQGRTREERRRAVVENLQRVKMQDYAERKPGQLSGGQQQRIALARALAAEPACLLLDEPLSNLDAQLRLQMRTELRRLVKSTGTTAIYVTHDQKEALSMGDRIAVMNQGQIAQIGTPLEVYERPENRFVAEFIGEANFIAGRVTDVRPDRFLIETAAGLLTARKDRPLTAGTQVDVCVRPEKVLLRAAANEAAATLTPGRLRGTVEQFTYLGEVNQYIVRLTDKTAWKITALATGSSPFEPGTEITLETTAEQVTVIC
jgi:ABC-type Fe3+/spermidine/putrescine transport system ATPase subunit